MNNNSLNSRATLLETCKQLKQDRELYDYQLKKLDYKYQVLKEKNFENKCKLFAAYDKYELESKLNSTPTDEVLETYALIGKIQTPETIDKLRSSDD